MNSDRDVPREDSSHWSADHPAVWCDTLRVGAAAPLSVSLRHPGYPLAEGVARSGGIGAIRELANKYLTLVQQRAVIGNEVLQALIKDDRPEFGWLPLTWGPGKLEQAPPNPRGSFRVARERSGASPEHTLVMLAGYRMKNKTSAGGEVGLRVLMHVRAGPDNSRWTVLVTGMSACRLPLGFKASKPLDPMDPSLQGRILALANALNFPRWAVDGMSYVDPTRDGSMRVFMSCGRPRPGGTSLRNYRVVADFPSSGADPVLLERSERISHANAKAFERDPASCSPTPAEIETRRPTRREPVLAPLRITTSRMRSSLKRPGGAMEVRQTRLGSVKGDPAKVQVITPSNLPLRSDAQAAAHAYLRGDELMRRLRAYGLNPDHYFKLVKQPLLLRHRAPLAGAGDGIAVNAQVSPVGVGSGLYPQITAQPIPGLMAELEVSFGWCDLSHRSRGPNDAGRERAQPLGLAADPRWAWHEFCHVLIFANLGELEFPFAHSAGDALAAIIADPDAKQVRHAAERFITFPWVFTPRRHDRSVMTGWCWCGRRNLARLARTRANAPRERRLGYFEEQLMSTSLFRLYRCIGGDSDPAACRSASDYTVYLVMSAIQLLGPQQAAPAGTVDQFVNALIHADLAAGAWSLCADWPEAQSPRQVKRNGGCVHKVILWAFEQQGLNATTNSGETVEGPGLPPNVDIYIADRRSEGEGGYWPVPLNVPAGQTPDWHAADSGVVFEQGKVVVRVRNRGQVAATGVAVKCWALPAGNPNANDPAAWLPLPASTGTPPTTVNLNSAAAFRFDPVVGGTPLSGPHFVKASATCPADRSNLDPMTTTALTHVVTPLVDLVANDNNIGLRILTF
jgi:hypothetical protein